MTAAGVILLRQRPTGEQLIAIPLAMIGLAMIIGLDWQGLQEDYSNRRHIWPADSRLLCRIFVIDAQGAYGLLARSTIPRNCRVLSLIAAAILGITAIAEGESLAIPSFGDAIWLACYGLLIHAVGLMFIASSLAKVTTTQVGIALLLQPSLSFTWDILFFNRPLTALEAIGATITLIAIYLGSRRSSHQA